MLRNEHRLARQGSPKMENKIEIKWLADPEDHDYPAAGSYLSLIYDEPAAVKYV